MRRRRLAILVGTFLLAGCAGVLLAAGLERGNLLPHPSAEAAGWPPKGWGLYHGTPGIKEGLTKEEAHSGTRSVYMTVVEFWHNEKTNKRQVSGAIMVGGSNGYTATGALPCEPDATYHFSFWIKSKGVHRPIIVDVTGWAADGIKKSRRHVTPKIVEGKVIAGDEWKQYHGSASFAAKPDTAKFAISIRLTGTDEELDKGATIWVDDAYVGLQPEASPE